MSEEKKLLELTKKLITIPSISGDKNQNDIVLDYVKHYLSSPDILTQEFTVNNVRSIAFYPKNSLKVLDIIFHGHTDVVPANTENDFEPYVKNNNLYGRGSCDMKGGLAILMVLFKTLIKAGNNRVALFVTSDEEVGGKNGTKFLFDELKPETKFFLTAEGSEGSNILKYKQKGVFQFQLEVQGIGGHAGYTWAGENAINKLYEVYSKIETLFPENKSDKDHWYTTINLATIRGGTVSNAIPDYAIADINIRFADDWKSEEKILKAIRRIIKQTPKTTITVTGSTPMIVNKKTNPLIVKLNKIACQELHLDKDLYFRNHGTNDARFAAAVGIPAVGFGPVGKNCHAKNEYISIASLKHYFNIYKKFVESF